MTCDIYLGKKRVRVTTGYDRNLCSYYTVGKEGGGTWTMFFHGLTNLTT